MGPMCRTADDCLKVFNAMLPPPALAPTRVDDASTTWKNIRIGVVRGLFPKGAPSSQFLTSVDTALALMRAEGATIEDVTFDDEQVLVGNNSPKGETAKFMSRSAFDFPAVIESYLANRNVGMAMGRTLEGLIA